MEFFQIKQKGYIIKIIQKNSILNIHTKKEYQKKEDKTKFKSIQLKFEYIDNEYMSNNQELINYIKDKTMIINIEEEFYKDKTHIKYLYLKLMKNDKSNPVMIVSKKIYALNVQYYLTIGDFHKRIYYRPIYTYIKKYFFNSNDILELIDKDNFFRI